MASSYERLLLLSREWRNRRGASCLVSRRTRLVTSYSERKGPSKVTWYRAIGVVHREMFDRRETVVAYQHDWSMAGLTRGALAPS